MAVVDFYFYYGCPWTYLASTRLQETAMRTGAQIAWKPVLIEHVQGQPPDGAPAGHAPISPARTRYAAKDLADWAGFCGVEIRRPGPYPLPARWALRGAMVALQEGLIGAYSEKVFGACFGAGADIDSLEVVTGLAVATGMDATDFRRRVQEPGTLRMLEDNSRELVVRGGFGSPTMFVGDDMYFGNDRMPLVELALSRSGERPFVVPGAHGQS
jgi:2-hydroxychromene-2-carboxylate isomerase